MREFDLLIIGTGSGNSIIGPEHDDWKVPSPSAACSGAPV